MTSRDTAPKDGVALRRGEQLEIEFSDLLANGQGVGRARGMVVFCFGPLPGERARVRITTVKQRYAVGDLVELLIESPARAQPFCPVFGECGGCQLQHLAYGAQLKWKRDLVRNALQRIGGLAEVDVSETIGMQEPRAYRNKMALVVESRDATPVLGFYRQRSHDIVPIDGCPIVMPALESLLKGLVERRSGSPLRDVLPQARHVVARASRATGDAVMTITSAKPISDEPQLGESLARELPGLRGVSNSYDLSSVNAILGQRHTLLAGEGEIEETIAGVRYRISAGSFFQINVEILTRIFEFISPWLERAGRAVDLYCGAGTFSLFFAKHGWTVHGIEENPDAVAEAVANARLNGLEERVRFEAARLEDVVALDHVRRIMADADVIFLDPPRKGCDEAVIASLTDAGAKELWYLSCDPATLARDLKRLVSKGYCLTTVQPFDMFPQTGHVEALVRLEHT